MPSLGYWAVTAGESVLSLFGIRSTYEQPAYKVMAQLAMGVEIRAYAERTAAETPIRDGRDDQAFSRLFAYITGNNGRPQSIPMTVPVERSAAGTLRFFLPRSIATNPPAPNDPSVRVVTLPAETVAARRFPGTLSRAEIARQDKILRAALAGSAWHAVGATARFGYDPPFTPPFLRRNEVVVPVSR